MALINCKECGSQVSADAKSCPHCGTHSITQSKLPLLLGILVVIGLIANALNKNDPPKVNVGPHINASGEIENEKVKESCAKIVNLFGYDSQLTAIQKEELWEQKYNGKHFKWKFQLVSADTQYDDDIRVVFTCLPPATKGHPALIQMSYPKELKSKVLNYKKGVAYAVEGILRGYEVPPDELADQVSVRISAEPLGQ